VKECRSQSKIERAILGAAIVLISLVLEFAGFALLVQEPIVASVILAASVILYLSGLAVIALEQGEDESPLAHEAALRKGRRILGLLRVAGVGLIVASLELLIHGSATPTWSRACCFGCSLVAFLLVVHVFPRVLHPGSPPSPEQLIIVDDSELGDCPVPEPQVDRLLQFIRGIKERGYR
jgi:hypothetical protein